MSKRKPVAAQPAETTHDSSRAERLDAFAPLCQRALEMDGYSGVARQGEDALVAAGPAGAGPRRALLRAYMTTRVSLELIGNAARCAVHEAVQVGAAPLLFVSCELPSPFREALQREFGIEIYDRERLKASCVTLDDMLRYENTMRRLTWC